jgi:4-amino-4-deoxy-L-arabinose transferase-like glycosyltransferase
MDEITPTKVMDGIDQHFSNGWYSKYPPLHYYILSLNYIPFLLLEQLHFFDIKTNLTVYTWLFILGRLISVIMGTAIVFLVYWCGCEIYERRAALCAALITTFMGPFVYYAKITNLDVPYIFWFVLSLVFFIRILKKHLSADYLLFALTAVCAICTKDQAYGFYILMPIPILISRHRFQKMLKPTARLWQTLLGRQIIFAFGAACFLFALIHNVLFNFSGFLNHLKLIFGAGSKGFQLYPNTLAGHMHMFWQAIKHLQFIFGWPMFIVCLLGFAVVLARKKRDRLLFALLIPGVSYYLFFISVVLYHYDRFLIPIAIILAFFGGKILAEWLSPQRSWYKCRLILFGLLAGYSFWYAASVDINMSNDSRYYVERWMTKHIKPDATIGMAGLWKCLPRTTHFKRIQLFPFPSGQSIEAARPDYLVINPAITFGSPDFYDKLGLTEMGYTLALQYRSQRKWALFDHETILKNGREQIYSNLDKINPEIKIYRLVDKTDKKQ